VGVVVEDLGAVAAFFAALGFEHGSPMVVEGEIVDAINGLDGVRAEILMVRAPDGSGTLELVKYHAPAGTGGAGAGASPPNRPGFRHLAIEVPDVNGAVDRLRADGFGTVGEVRDYGTSYRLVYVRGPEGLIVELAERLPAGRASAGAE
jgi:catechol 2,3-dioxygenase-like lactoylglutathione lyase family enzyme